ncbi:MAG TPA: heterodisulfide reductase-related iron-sulfur binding cluster [Micropepsaceae bacterium]|nr:heterodisulfide reductase-related iron-sulfur binding cluster [Micropepsaceae bacterium]
MRTNFRSELLSDPHVKDAEHALRTCVHCGFCTATCPTYVLLGDERDSPRGRIMLMQQMLESGGAPNAETVRHLDRCLSCLGCRTACPSGVDYSALIDQSRVHIERHYRRPLPERLFRNLILFVLTRPGLFAALSVVARGFAPIVSRLPGRIGAMARKAAKRPPTRNLLYKFRPPREGEVTGGENPREIKPSFARRILLLPGCVQRALAPEIDSAVTRVLAHQGDRVECLRESGCCGALALHLGKADIAKQHARALIRACEDAGQADAILISASGCTAFLKDYGKLFADDPEWKPRAEKLAAKARDFVELARPAASPSAAAQNAAPIAFHPPCSLQHGQRISGIGEALLRSAGFTLAPIPDAHLCCGSAGSYSLLQPEIAERLRAKKLADMKSAGAAAIVSDNIGCLSHLAGELPVFHIAEALDEAVNSGRHR